MNPTMIWPAAQAAASSLSGVEGLESNNTTFVAGVLCLVAAAVSSAGGLGGGALFLPILALVAQLPLKQAAAFTAFMVVGNSAANVICTTFLLRQKGQRGTNYAIAVLSEPCLLLGVSVGVICNIVLPEWLVTLMFAVVVACSTFKTCHSGVSRWKAESEKMKSTGQDTENGVVEPLLRGRTETEPERVGSSRMQLKTVYLLALVWICFFVIQVVTADSEEKIIVDIKPCSWTYWAITSSQVPLAILFTAYALYEYNPSDDQKQTIGDVEERKRLSGEQTGNLLQFLFPLAALLTGVLSGLFGVGGGILLNPALLHMGINPQVTAATCAFMMLFTSSMTSAQYLLLGTVRGGGLQALVLAVGCVAASTIGLLARQRCVQRLGRPSVIVFAVGTVMALSTVSMTYLGTLDVWREYGDSGIMGFKALC